MSNMRL